MKQFMSNNAVLIIDFHNFLRRAHFAFSDNKPDSCTTIFNFFRNLRAILEQFNPQKCFLAFEGRNNFRYDLYPDYKANRIIKTGSKKQDLEDSYFRQKELLVPLLKKLPLNIVQADKYEADDVIATLVENLKNEQIIIISNDSDFVQLLQKGYNNLKIYNPHKKEFAYPPNYSYLTWKCLAGDVSDNIPGLLGSEKAIKYASSPVDLRSFLSSVENRSLFNLNRQLIELKIIPDEELNIFDYNVDFTGLREALLNMSLTSLVEDKYWNKFVKTFNNLI